MRWKNYKLLILLCYFCACSCFCLAAFLPRALTLSGVNSSYTEKSKELKAVVTGEIAQTDQKKKKKPKPGTLTACDE